MRENGGVMLIAFFLVYGGGVVTRIRRGATELGR